MKRPFEVFRENIPQDIKRALEAESPLTPGLLKVRTGYNWHTVKRALDKLEHEGIVKGQQMGRMTIYSLVTGGTSSEPEG